MIFRRRKQPEKPDAGRQRRYSIERQAPSAFSYHAKRSDRPESMGRQQPSAVEKRNRLLSLQFWAKRSGFVIAAIAVIVCVISLLSLSTQPRIVLIDQDDKAYAFRDNESYKQAVAEYLSSSIWNRNKLTVNTGAASADLQRRFPELAKVTVTLPFVGQRPIFYLHANPPAFVLQAVNGTYVIDSSGTALIAKDAAPAAVVSQLPVITDQTGARVQLGKQIISGAHTQFIQTVVATLEEKQVKVTSLVLPANTVQELDVRVEGQPYIIKFSLHEPTTARQQAGTYLALANTLAEKGVTPNQYVDVRVPGRAYYL